MNLDQALLMGNSLAPHSKGWSFFFAEDFLCVIRALIKATDPEEHVEDQFQVMSEAMDNLAIL